MGCQSFLLPVWCGDCKEELGVRLFRAVPDGQETFMGAGWATSHS